MPDLPLNECPLIQLKELERGLRHNPRRVEHQFPDVMVGREDLRPPGGGNSSLLGGRPVQTAQLNAHGLHQAAGAGPLSWPPRMAYQAALNTLHTWRDSRPLRSLKTVSC